MKLSTMESKKGEQPSKTGPSDLLLDLAVKWLV